jgi:hypothetical protein
MNVFAITLLPASSRPPLLAARACVFWYRLIASFVARTKDDSDGFGICRRISYKLSVQIEERRRMNGFVQDSLRVMSVCQSGKKLRSAADFVMADSACQWCNHAPDDARFGLARPLLECLSRVRH